MDYCKITNDRCCYCIYGICEHRITKVTEPERAEIIRQAVDVFGPVKQTDIAIEEMAELTKALLKMRRPGVECLAAVQEELVDVQITLDQLKIIYGWQHDVEQEKLLRLKAMVTGE